MGDDLQKQLDLTINQRLTPSMYDRESRAEPVRRSLVDIQNDISSFARFLKDNKCLEVLLFWKEVEQFKGLFTREEKAALFTKIYDLYCKPGAVWEVNFRGAHVKDITKAKEDGGDKGDVDEEVFDAAQLEIYEMMRLDLFPRFADGVKKLSGTRVSTSAALLRSTHAFIHSPYLSLYLRYIGLVEDAEERAKSISEVTSGNNPAATRSFMRFLREQMCEEVSSIRREHSLTHSSNARPRKHSLTFSRPLPHMSPPSFVPQGLLFWMEANDYALLFQPSDLVTKANEIYDVYMGPNAAVKVNVADRVVKDVEKQMKENNITNFLFVNAQKDIVRAQCHHNLRVCILSTPTHVSDRCGMHCCCFCCCRCTCSSRISSRATRSGAIRRVSSSRRAPRGTRSACWIARGSAIGRR